MMGSQAGKGERSGPQLPGMENLGADAFVPPPLPSLFSVLSGGPTLVLSLLPSPMRVIHSPPHIPSFPNSLDILPLRPPPPVPSPFNPLPSLVYL